MRYFPPLISCEFEYFGKQGFYRREVGIFLVWNVYEYHWTLPQITFTGVAAAVLLPLT